MKVLKKWDICTGQQTEEDVDSFGTLIGQLEKRFGSALPGRDAQMKMASLRRLKDGIPLEPPPGARQAGVLVLLYPVKEIPYIVLIQRIEYEGVHSGQISFPGGERERQDRTDIDTALREAWEETGISPGEVNILGHLSKLYIPPSNFLVTPVVGYSIRRPDFVADPSEVQGIIEMDLRLLRQREVIQEKQIVVNRDYRVTAPCYFADGHIIWGATAMILCEFLEMLG